LQAMHSNFLKGKWVST